MTLSSEQTGSERSRLQHLRGSNGSEVSAREPRGHADGWASTSAFSAERLVEVPELFERFPYGLVLADRDGRVLSVNRKARQMLAPTALEGSGISRTCCALICSRLGPIVGPGCLSERVAVIGDQLPEVRMDIEEGRLQSAAWVTVSALDPDGSRVLFHLRPGVADDRRRRACLEWTGRVCAPERPELQISTLGRFRVEGRDGPINGDWLDQRPGQLLKYLVCERRRVVTSDQINEAIWPEAGVDKARNRVRYYVHALREKLEPDRAYRSPARLVVGRGGGYVLDTNGAWIDVDEFEREARAGLSAFAQGLKEPAATHLSCALRLYQDDFLCEEPYLEWALEERERLRELAGQALRAQVHIDLSLGWLSDAAGHARRLSDLEPFDTDVQRLFIEICLRRGKRSEASRRYSLLRRHMLNSFGQEPDFELRELEREAGNSAEV